MKKPKIALLGNMNNNSFAFARYFRDMGLDAHVLLFKNDFLAEHFLPKADSYDDTYHSFVHELRDDLVDDLYLSFSTRGRSKWKVLNDQLDEYDIFIGSGYTPILFGILGRKLDVFIPYGGDVSELPFCYKKPSMRKYILDVLLNSLIMKFGLPLYVIDRLRNHRLLNMEPYFLRQEMQRKGIKNAKHIIMGGTNREHESVLVQLGVKEKPKYLLMPAIYTPQYSSEAFKAYCQKSEFYSRMQTIRKKNDLVVFHHTRQSWKNFDNPYNSKGNDLLFKGFSDFLHSHSKVKACLVCFEYGKDVAESKSLIKSLGIDKHVVWFPKMHRKDIMVGIAMADIGAVDFANTWLTGGVLFEFLLMGVPVMKRFIENEIEWDDSIGLHPMFKANSVLDIQKTFEQFIQDPAFFKDIGLQGKEYFQKKIKDPFINFVISEVVAKAAIADYRMDT